MYFIGCTIAFCLLFLIIVNVIKQVQEASNKEKNIETPGAKEIVPVVPSTSNDLTVIVVKPTVEEEVVM
ncbi:hypothetical protein LX64_00585 [Chitinophaga skermanii]|uniref:Uncharacterized protein n=1 Tax=Chitinophaga skermanii TaxID=331697 RepID=A0A327R4J2_9BACT|nr:hypothetical protein [Chitinophaga skermanii]RAJ10978.1 hypothetical protein LX64_00585 [Chitinophaga skermanii]